MALPQQVEHAPTQDNFDELDLRLTQLEIHQPKYGEFNTTAPSTVYGSFIASLDKIGTGDVRVTFKPDVFPIPPVVVGMSSAGICDSAAEDVTTTTCRLRRYDDTGTATDGRISFIAGVPS